MPKLPWRGIYPWRMICRVLLFSWTCAFIAVAILDYCGVPYPWQIGGFLGGVVCHWLLISLGRVERYVQARAALVKVLGLAYVDAVEAEMRKEAAEYAWERRKRRWPWRGRS